MKRITIRAIIPLVAFVQLALSQPVGAQDAEFEDRLARLRDITSNSELVLVWTQDDDPPPGPEFINQRIYDLDLTESNPDRKLVRKPVIADSVIAGNRRIAVAVGNFLGGEFKHFAAAWTGEGNSITVIVPDIDAGSLSWSNAGRATIPGPASTAQTAKLHLTTGDFLGTDMRDEFVVGYQSDDGTIHLHHFQFIDDSLTPIPLSTISDESTVTGTVGGWDLVSGDFDGDSHHEIALLFVKPLGGSDWTMQAKIYDIDSSGDFVPKATLALFGNPGSVTATPLAAAAGDFDNDAEIEIAFAFAFWNGFNPDTYLYILDVSLDLNTITTNDQTMRFELSTQNDNEVTPLNLAAGDLYGNGRDEIVLNAGGALSIFTIDDQLTPERRCTGGGQSPFYDNDSDYFLELSDMDADGLAEIVTAGSFVNLEPNGEQNLLITVSKAGTGLLCVELVATRQNEVPVTNNVQERHYAMALGDLDADRLWMGMPTRFSRKAILRPSVVLNTPPVHYDILDGTPYDLSGCFPTQSCGFEATYTQTSANEMTVSIETHEDWGTSESISGQIEVKGKATRTYGEKFSLTSTRRDAIQISTGRVAAGDDWIYTSIYDIDFYEYPVFDGQDPTPIGFFIVAVPGPVRPLWIEVKDDELLGNQFRQDHEVGNVLSYRPVNTTDIASLIVDFPEQTVGSTGSSFASLQLSTFSESNAETSWESSLEFSGEVGLTGDIFGIELGASVETSAKYSFGEVSTQTVTVESSLEMKADFGHLEQQFGTSGTYQIQPYAYWTMYGALAIDYKVSLPTGANSFWQQWYGGKTDPGFSVPWRYDVEKGSPLPLNDPSYLRRTRDIVLSRPDPEPGDTVIIGARVRNMALADLVNPVRVDFYDGDPAGGGSLIASVEVNSIRARESENVFVEWPIPASASLFDKRVYVVIDPDDRITDEVHDNNNIGWAPVVAFGLSTDSQEEDEPPRRFRLHQNFPNPFAATTTVPYSLPHPARVRIDVYDVLGRNVARLFAGLQAAGSHEVMFDASNLASGLYYYRLQSEGFGETKRMIVVR